MARAVAPSSNMRSNGRAVSRLNELQAPATNLWQHMPRRPWDDFCPGRCLSSRVQPFPQAPSREVPLTPPSKICSTASLAASRPDRSSRSRRLASVGDLRMAFQEASAVHSRAAAGSGWRAEAPEDAMRLGIGEIIVVLVLALLFFGP